MTRTLVLMRHAKAGDSSGSDYSRKLTDRGRRNAQEAGTILATYGLDYALVSGSARTRETFEYMGLKIPAEFQDALYLDGVDPIVQRIGEVQDDVNGLIVVGHAPDIPALASRLAYWATQTDPNHAQADAVQCGFATSDYAIFKIEQTWEEFADDFLELRPIQQIEIVGGTAFTW